MQRLISTLTLTVLGLLIVGTLGFLGFRHHVLTVHGEVLESAVVHRPPGSVQVFARDGRLIDTHWQERRFWVPLDSLPDHVTGAIVSAEDGRFRDHGGVDLRGVLRALGANLAGGRITQGASTLTQQLVKNLIVGDARTVRRKLEEAVLAWELERRLDKDRILELYVNQVYLGSGNHGLEAAARDTFGIGAAALTVEQAATLAGAIPAPSRWEARTDPRGARVRRDRVLRAMARDGRLTTADLTEALAQPLRVLPRDRGTASSSGAAYATVVRRQLRNELGDVPFAVGMQVQTALDPGVQEVAETAVREAAAAVQARQGLWAVRDHLERSERAAFLARAPVVRDGDCLEALWTGRDRLSTAVDRHWTLTAGERARRVRNRERAEGVGGSFGAVVRIGDVVGVCAVGPSTVVLDDAPWVQGAAVVIEHGTGEVVALVGGTEPVLEGFVRATQGRRQPGSTFKPVVMAAALEAGRRQTSVVVDGPVVLPAGDGTLWRPGNAGGYAGPVSLRTALARSLNAVAVKLTDEVGADVVVDMARRLGVRTPIPAVPSVALGATEVTPLDLAVATATLANGGMWREPRFIRRVDDREGRVLGAAAGAVRVDGRVEGRLPGRVERAISAGVALEVADMMTAVIERGTGRAAHRPGFWRAGKTGTTNRATDTWFAGSTPRHTVVVWIGADDGGSLGAGESGSRTALPAWAAIVEALPEVAGEEPPIPAGARWRRWNGRWVVMRRPGF